LSKIPFFSVDSDNLEGGDEGVIWRRPEKTYGEVRDGSTSGTKERREKVDSDCVEGLQKKKVLSYSRKKLSKQVLPVDGSVMSAKQKVSDACDLIQKSLANLVELVETSSNLNDRPKSIEAHPNDSCQEAHLGNKGDCGSGEGVDADLVWKTESSGSQLLVCENMSDLFSMIAGNKESKITVIVDDECKGVRTDYKEVFGTRRVIGRTRRNR